MNVQTITSTGSAVFIPPGAKLLSVKGSNADADTYAVQVTYIERYSSTNNSHSITYAGIPNGQSLKLDKDFPVSPTVQTVPAANGDRSISIIPGTTGQCEVYYALGASVLDSPKPPAVFSAPGLPSQKPNMATAGCGACVRSTGLDF